MAQYVCIRHKHATPAPLLSPRQIVGFPMWRLNYVEEKKHLAKYAKQIVLRRNTMFKGSLHYFP